MSGNAAPEGNVLLRTEGPIAWITLNRPERLNALAGAMRDQLAEAVAEAGRRERTRVIVLTGAGRGFCAGADVDVMGEILAGDDHQRFAELVQAGMRVVRRIREARQPVIAAVNGVAAGAGASLAAACDLRIASSAASIGFTFNRIGLHPDWGASLFLPRLVGAGRALELFYSGRLVEAEEAERIGLVERVAPAAEFPAAVEALARELTAKPPLAVSLVKRTLSAGIGRAVLEEALREEAEAQMACFRSRDLREGLAAFRERRPPVFRGE